MSANRGQSLGRRVRARRNRLGRASGADLDL